MPFQLKDANLIETKALPNGAATIYSTGFDLGPINAILGERLQECEIEVLAPLLTTVEQPDAKTLKYSVQTATDSAFTSPVTIAADILTQTGAGGAGAAAASVRYRLTSQTLRYVRIRAIGSAAGDSSAKSLTHRLVF